MAKDKRSSGNRKNGKLSGEDYRASHRAYSAASVDRKKQAGMTRVSLWVPVSDAEALKRYAKGLCEGHEPEASSGDQAGERWLTVITVLFMAPRRKRTRARPDDRQLDLFGPA